MTEGKRVATGVEPALPRPPGDLIKMIWWDGQGACFFSKRLKNGRFVRPSAKDGKVALTPAQVAMLLEGIDWRTPQRTWRPLRAG